MATFIPLLSFVSSQNLCNTQNNVGFQAQYLNSTMWRMVPLSSNCRRQARFLKHRTNYDFIHDSPVFHSFLYLSPQFFTDGITNKLLGCYVGAVMQDVVLVRIYGNKTELLVDRENEVKSFRVLHAQRCAPRLYCTFNNGLCYEFLQGTALEPEHIRSQPVFR